MYYGSDYFETCFSCAVQLIKDGKAYVDDLTQEEMRQYRGSLTEPGKPSPYRDRSVEENLQLFQDMRDGKFADGSKTLRAKIDMASPNMNLRDPAIYRIVRAHHHRQGDKWCIYPLYDFAHPIQDALEGITHSMCSIEFENHRPLYEWVVDNCPLPHHPKQREFARLNVTHTVMSKRYLRQLVFEKHVEAGTTRVCLRCVRCVAAATRRALSSILYSAPASQRPTRWLTSSCSSTASARS